MTSPLRDAIGIVHETKNRWERRVPLVPSEVRALVAEGVDVRVERSPSRAFTDEEFAAVGATLVDDATDCRLLLGVKEVKPGQVHRGQTVMCFSHTIKGQSHNMPLLAHFMNEGATLVDYEVVVDDRGVRQVAFGRYAGLAGAHETLWTLAHRLAARGRPTPLTALRHAVDYHDLGAMASAARDALARAASDPAGAALAPFVVAVTGKGRVSLGALEYLDLVGARRVTVAEAVALHGTDRGRELMALHLPDEALYERAGASGFDFADYLAHPSLYVCTGAKYLPYARALVNGLYWDDRFPRLLDASTLQRMYRDGTLPPALGDVACDISGGIEWTVRATENDAPAFVYDPGSGAARVGVEGDGVAIMAVDNLPTALPRDASVDFSRALAPFVRPFFRADFGRDGVAGLPSALQTAVVVAAGRLTARHAHLERFVRAAAGSSDNA